MTAKSRAGTKPGGDTPKEGSAMSINVRVRVGVEWINDFHKDSCQQNDLSYCDDQVVGFYNHMGNHGHTKVFDWGNDNAWETDFRHPDFGGDSLNWSDDVHFCMVNDHGGNSSNVVSFWFSKAHTQCSVSSTQMRLGRKNLKWIAALGCDAVLNTHADHIVACWGGPMQGVHIVCGYIGTAADSWWTADLGEDFADDLAGDVGQAEVAAAVAEGQALVVEAEEVEDRGVEVVHVDLVLHGLVPELVGRAEREAGLHAGAGEPDGEAVGVVVAAGAVLLGVRGVAELAPPPDQDERPLCKLDDAMVEASCLLLRQESQQQGYGIAGDRSPGSIGALRDDAELLDDREGVAALVVDDGDDAGVDIRLGENRSYRASNPVPVLVDRHDNGNLEHPAPRQKRNRPKVAFH